MAIAECAFGDPCPQSGQCATGGIGLAALQEALQLAEPILRIECFDISHTHG